MSTYPVQARDPFSIKAELGVIPPDSSLSTISFQGIDFSQMEPGSIREIMQEIPPFFTDLNFRGTKLFHHQAGALGNVFAAIPSSIKSVSIGANHICSVYSQTMLRQVLHRLPLTVHSLDLSGNTNVRSTAEALTLGKMVTVIPPQISTLQLNDYHFSSGGDLRFSHISEQRFREMLRNLPATVSKLDLSRSDIFAPCENMPTTIFADLPRTVKTLVIKNDFIFSGNAQEKACRIWELIRHIPAGYEVTIDIAKDSLSEANIQRLQEKFRHRGDGISFLVLGCFSALLGTTAVALALTILQFAIVPVTLGAAACFVASIGFFAVGGNKHDSAQQAPEFINSLAPA